jgi:hypothetical protein
MTLLQIHVLKVSRDIRKVTASLRLAGLLNTDSVRTNR